MSKLVELFKTENPVIGMIHLMPLMGYRDFTSLEEVMEKALGDLKTLEKGGVDGVMIENNYDLPHKIFVDPETVASMTYVICKLRKMTKLPLGVCVLWNDYRAALAIAKSGGASFIRIPVFVDCVKTSYGTVEASYKEVQGAKNELGAEDILLFTDIHVKHATILNKERIEISAKKAMQNGSDALIVTGKWTADAPLIEDLRKVRKKIGNFPIIIGSGATEKNAHALLEYGNGIIVGTSLKTGKKQVENVNIKSYREKISLLKVKRFIKAVKL